MISSEHPEMMMNVNDLIEVIKFGYLEKEIRAIRNAKSKVQKDKLKKSSLPAITTSGVFEPRSSKGFKKHNGLIQIDIDDVVDYDVRFNQLIKDPYSYIAFRSPSGNGIKLIVKINPSKDTHLGQFYALQEYYSESYEIELDRSCKDLARCMLLSFDPNLFCNPASEVFDGFTMPEERIVNEEKVKYYENLKDEYDIDDERIIAFIANELSQRKIDITSAYENWIQIGFAIASTLGEIGRVYYHQISSVYPEYNQNEIDKVYSRCLKRNDGRVTVGTLIYHSKINGVDLSELYESKRHSIQKPKAKAEKINLYDVLKEWRYRKSKEIRKPAFTIFSNKVLKELVEAKPANEKELLNISGFGKIKFDQFGLELIKLIQKSGE